MHFSPFAYHTPRTFHPTCFDYLDILCECSKLCSFLQSPVTSSLLGPNISLNTLSLCSCLNVTDQVSHPSNTSKVYEWVMDIYEHGSHSELCTAQRISSLADTLSAPHPTPKKDTLFRLDELASPAFRWQIPLNFGWRVACLTSSAERHVRQTVAAAT
jgi:hypothetical protein